MLRRVWLFLMFLVILSASMRAQSNVVYGQAAWKSVLFVPDPAFWTGVDGIQDQRCEVTSSVFNSGWAGPMNQIASFCGAVPHPQTGAWNVSVRLTGYTGHTADKWFRGYELGTEGRRINGVETTNRVYLWEYNAADPAGGRAIWYRDLNQPNLFAFGETAPGKQIDLYVTGNILTLKYMASPLNYAVTVMPDGSQRWEAGVSKTGTCQQFRNGLCVK